MEIPSTPETVIALPGIGPKITYIYLEEAFDLTGLGVANDTHVNQFAITLNWVESPTASEKEKKMIDAERIRWQLQDIFSDDTWHLINPLCGMLGQALQSPELWPKLFQTAKALGRLEEQSLQMHTKSTVTGTWSRGD